MSRKKSASTDLGTTENEGLILSLVVRQQPVTAYQLYRILVESPTKAINASKGQLYPAIRRLEARGMIKREEVSGDRRQSEHLFATDLGREAVRNWVQSIDVSHIVLDDPLRTRVLAFESLSKSEQVAWVIRAKALVKAKHEELDRFNDTVQVPFQRYAYMTAKESLRIKMSSLDELLYELTGTVVE